MIFYYDLKNGIKLTMAQMMDISETYELYCTAEYLLDNFDLSEGKAIDKAREIRRDMNKYGISEFEAIERRMENYV